MIYYTDGFTIGGNPSQVGGGFTIVDEDNNLVQHETIEKAGMTNNESELLGVLEALKICSSRDKIVTDSKNTMAWVKSGNPKARPDLKELCVEAKKLAEEKRVLIEWSPRAENLAGIYNEQSKGVQESGGYNDAEIRLREIYSLIGKLRQKIKGVSSSRQSEAVEHLDRLESEIRSWG